MKRSAILVAALVLAPLCGASGNTRVVGWEEIGESVQIRGRLGVPLGEFVEVEAIVIPVRKFTFKPAIQDRYVLKILAIAGSPVSSELVMYYSAPGDLGDSFPYSFSRLYEIKKGRRPPEISAQETEDLERDFVGVRMRLLVHESGGFYPEPSLPKEPSPWPTPIPSKPWDPSGRSDFKSFLTVHKVIEKSLNQRPQGTPENVPSSSIEPEARRP